MEKYGQYRDKGSGIAPFFPVTSETSSPLLLPWYLFLFCIRVPLVSFAWIVWLSIVQFTTPGNLLRKANLWCVLGIPGVWWIDLQVDGVRRGSLSQTPKGRLPGAGTVIASSYTSPLDILYLAAIFDPIFTQSQAGSRLVRPLSIEGALAACFDIRQPFHFHTQYAPLELSELIRQNATRTIVVFPEGTTSNGRAILKFSPSLLSATVSTKIFPVSLRYTPADIVTPIPGWLEILRFIWRLNSSPTHCIRVRIGGPATKSSPASISSSGSPASNTRSTSQRASGYDANFFDTLNAEKVSGDAEGEDQGDLSPQDRQMLDAVGDALARLGRVKRVGLGVEEKKGFVEAWRKRSKARQ